MTTLFPRGCLLGLTLAALVPRSPGAAGPKPDHSAVRPVPRMEMRRWVERHEEFLERARQGGVNVLFLGDSITEGWKSVGKEVWDKRFEPLGAANFGIIADRTEHVLWRVTEGKELEGIRPRVVVLMIGTNNLGTSSPEEIADGVAAVVRAVTRRPGTKVLLLGVFPRGAGPTHKDRAKVKAVNRRLARLEGKQVRFLDIGAQFLDKEGNISPEIMPDYIHPSAKGYRIWGDAIASTLDEMLKK